MALFEKKEIQYRGVFVWIDAGKEPFLARMFVDPLRFSEGERRLRKGVPHRHSSCFPYPGRI